MTKVRFNTAQFITSSIEASHYPKLCNSLGTKVPQIAICGRSNVGKSSLINALFSNKKLAKVSQTPGKTQMINFFLVDDQFFCIDLPGYGFARCPKEVKKSWGTMIDTFFKTVPELSMLFFLLDSRRKPNEEDFEFFNWAAWHNIPLVFVITKIDKLKKQEKQQQKKLILDAFDSFSGPVIMQSNKTNEGIDEIRNILTKMVHP